MIARLQVIVCLFGLVALFACEVEYEVDENYIPPVPAPMVPETQPFHPIEEFRLPDSLARDLIIAAYDELMPLKARVALIYSDSTRKSALKISYLINGKVNVEPLIVLKPNEFRSKFTAETYVVTGDKV